MRLGAGVVMHIWLFQDDWHIAIVKWADAQIENRTKILFYMYLIIEQGKSLVKWRDFPPTHFFSVSTRFISTLGSDCWKIKHIAKHALSLRFW